MTLQFVLLPMFMDNAVDPPLQSIGENESGNGRVRNLREYKSGQILGKLDNLTEGTAALGFVYNLAYIVSQGTVSLQRLMGCNLQSDGKEPLLVIIQMRAY